ncbi:hypothetical protein FIBSPDRAFT_289413 [Athelia psychrophila]|uniref:Uncharacterized protein n=1 Tax=Athelia psychrophila TaxID=1759441 RepID=A0A167XJ73_9AGAM|nr:hypothetical protein FIBSPDRAFT_289413 [Fibularhizoctonia sp. CBS 109695]
MNSKDTSDASAFDWASGSGTPRPPLHFKEMWDNRNGPGSWAKGYTGSPVLAPSQPRPSGTSALNPLNLRKHDILTRKHGSSTTNNPTSVKTVVSAKRNQDWPSVQTPKQHGPNEPRRASGNPVAGPRGIHSSREGEQNATPTAIFSPSEDEGQSSSTRSSPDPLTLYSTTFKHASDNTPPRLRLGYTPPRYTGDPPAVQRLLNKLRQPSKEIIIYDSGDDSQEFSDRPLDQSQSAEARRYTQSQESAYSKGGTTRSAAKESARSSIPHIDLSLMQRRPIASNPKSAGAVQLNRNPFRPKPTGGDQFGDDPLAAPTLITSKSQQKSPSQAKQEDSVELPLEAWSCGVKIYDTGTLKFFFVWNPQTCTVSVRCNREQGPSTVIEQICINQIADFKVANGLPITSSMLLIQLGTLAYDRKGRTEEHYKPGSQAADGKLTFNFSVQSADWSDAKYKKMVAGLRKQSIDTDASFTFIDVHGSDTLWEGAIFAQETYNNRVKKRTAPATVFQATAEASNPDSSVSTIPASSIAR